MERAWRRGAAAALSGLAAVGCAHHAPPATAPHERRAPKAEVVGPVVDPARRQYLDERRRRYYYFDRQKREYFWENGDPKS